MKVNHIDISHFLKNRYHYKIPDFQRPYSWGVSNANTVLEDLESSISSGKKHFFGSVVWISQDDERVIIDGQQRVTTVLLMLIAIYHILGESESQEEIDLAKRLNDEYLYDQYNEEHKRLKLRTVTDDNTFFKNIYEKELDNPECRRSSVYKVYRHFYTYFRGKEKLYERYVSGLSRLEVVELCLDDNTDSPQKIFESINATGRPLEDGDKIRNFVLMVDNKKARATIFNKYWKVIEQSLRSEQAITDFFFNFLIAVRGREIRLGDIYPEFKSYFNEKIDDHSNLEKMFHFYENILRYLNHYLFLRYKKDENQLYVSFHNENFRINHLRIWTNTPFLMSVLEAFVFEKIGKNDVKEVFKITESYLVRRMINGGTGGANKFFPGIFNAVESIKQKHPGSSYSNAYAYLLLSRKGVQRLLDDEEIFNKLPSMDFYSLRSYYKQFILTSIDDCQQSNESHLLRDINESNRQLTIEHIMPQTLTEEWKAELGENYQEIHARYLNTLANLTLTGYSSKYSNNSFIQKKSMENGFNDSPLLINDFVKKEETWNRDALERRGRWWAEQVVKIWPLPKTTIQDVEDDQVQEVKADQLFETDLTGSKPYRVTVFGDYHGVNNWSDLLDVVFEAFYERYSNFKWDILNDDILSKHVSENAEDFRASNEIFDTSIFINSYSNTAGKIELIKRLCKIYNIQPENLKINF